MNHAIALDSKWSPPECQPLSLAQCLVRKLNPQKILLFLHDGEGQDVAMFQFGNREVIKRIRSYPESKVDLFVVVNPPNTSIDNSYGAGVVVIDLKSAVDKAFWRGIRLIGDDGFHLRPIDDPYEEDWQLRYAVELFNHLVNKALAQGGGVVTLDDSYFDQHPYTP